MISDLGLALTDATFPLTLTSFTNNSFDTSFSFGNSGNLSPGCLCAPVCGFLGVLLILELDNPETGYFPRDGIDNLGASPPCLGTTKAFVCLIKLRSLQSADIKGKSIFLDFSLNVNMSNGVCFLSPDVVFVSVSDGGGGGGGNLLGFTTGGSIEFNMLSSERVRMNLEGRVGGNGGGTSRLPIVPIVPVDDGALYTGNCT